MPEKAEEKANPIKSFVSGGFGGICNVLVGHPLDTIKVRLQTMPTPAPGQKPLYSGTFDCAAKTIRNEGVLGLYKGMSAPLTGVAPIFAMCFAGYTLGKRLQQTDDNAHLTYPQLFVAGSFSGLFSTAITAPGERIKCLLQVQQASGGEKKYNGMVDTAVKLYKEGGIRSIYKGSCATLLRDLPANGFYFLVYEYLQVLSKQRSGSDQVSMVATIFAGGAAGIAYWLVGMPADVLKSRLQTAPEGTYKQGIRSVFKDLMAKEGPLALYRGVTPIMIRAFPANAACFFGIELANCPANGIYFLSYEAVRNFMKRMTNSEDLSVLAFIFAGGVAGITYWIAGMPADVLKSRLQTAPEGTYKHGIRSVFVELMKKEGPFALYRGVIPVMLRAVPANAVTFLGIEVANNVMARLGI